MSIEVNNIKAVFNCNQLLLYLYINIKYNIMEVWKDIKGFENQYQISNIGNLRSKDRLVKHSKGGLRKYKGKAKKIRINNKGYFRCNLKNNGNRYDFSIHRLVAEAFLNNKGLKNFVNHKNGIKTDNRAENLEWCTPRENTFHAVKNGLIKSKLSEKQVIEIYNSKLTHRKLSSKYNVSTSIIWRIKNKLGYKHITSKL